MVRDAGDAGVSAAAASARPSVAYDFASGVTGSLDAVVGYGADGTRFGGWRGRSGVTASLRVAF